MKAVHENGQQGVAEPRSVDGRRALHGSRHHRARRRAPGHRTSAILDYRTRRRVSQFILSGWPKLDEMRFFGSHILPLVRERERERHTLAPAIATVQWDA